MSELVYFLCAITAALCAFLLLRAYFTTRTRLMLWGGLTFTGLTLNNIALILDVVVFPEMDLQPVRAAFAFVSILPLLFGLVWES